MFSIFKSLLEELNGSRANRQLLSGAVIISFANAGGLLLSVLLTVILARLLGPESYGIYEVSLAATGVMVLIASAGIDTTLLRFVAQYQERQEWQPMGSLLAWARRNLVKSTLLASLLLLLGALVAPNSLSPEWRQSLYLCAAMLPCWAFNNLRQAALKGLQRVLQARLPEVLLKPLLLLGCVGLLAYFTELHSAPQALLANFAALLLVCFLGKVLLQRALRQLPDQISSKTQQVIPKEWGSSSYWLLLVSVTFVLSTELDKILLSFVVPAIDVGIYAAAARWATIVPYAAEAANTVAAPLIAAAYASGDRKRLESLLAYSALVSLLFALVPIGLLLCFGQELLGMSGPEYGAAYAVLCILVLGQAAQLWFGPAIHVLMMSGQQRLACWPLVAVVLALFCIAPWSGYNFGLTGAAISVAAILCMRNALLWHSLRRSTGIDSSLCPALVKGAKYLRNRI
jgi:O-antigen/teichoic acid export membrane protein